MSCCGLVSGLEGGLRFGDKHMVKEFFLKRKLVREAAKQTSGPTTKVTPSPLELIGHCRTTSGGTLFGDFP